MCILDLTFLWVGGKIISLQYFLIKKKFFAGLYRNFRYINYKIITMAIEILGM